jgi:hypothetical protein
MVSSEQRSATTDHPHSPVTADLQISTRQASRLPKTLEETLGTVLIKAGES